MLEYSLSLLHSGLRFSVGILLVAALLVGGVSAMSPSSNANELGEKIGHELLHRFFDLILSLGIDCVKHLDVCRREAKARNLPPMTPAQVAALRRSLKLDPQRPFVSSGAASADRSR